MYTGYLTKTLVQGVLLVVHVKRMNVNQEHAKINITMKRSFAFLAVFQTKMDAWPNVMRLI